jgi:predicted GNAT family N-acyltransferase
MDVPPATAPSARSFSIEVLAWSDALRHARPIREAVFIIEQQVPRELEWDEWDARSQHALARDEQGRAVGTARLLPDGHLGRMAVLADWRARGVGSALAQALIERARAQGVAAIVLHAQVHAAGFYRRLGFSERGPVFGEAGIAHVEMTLPLAP